MAYSPYYPAGWKDWPDVSTPITSAALKHIEDGIAAGGSATSPLTTKGDVWGFSTVDARIPVGSDNQVLTADSTQALGVKWSAVGPASGAMTVTGGGNETVDTVAASTATLTVDLTNGNVYDVTLTANCTLTLAGATNNKGDTLTLLLRQDATGSRTVTWPASVAWVGGTAPILQTAASSVDIVTLFTVNGGTNWYGIFGAPLKAIGASAYNTASQSISTGTWTAINLDGENWDTASLHDTVTNNSRITVPVAGKYICTFRATFDHSTAGSQGRFIGFGLNGSADPHSLGSFSVSSTFNTAMSISEVKNLSANDYIQGMVFQDTGGALSVFSGAVLSISYVGS